MVVVVVDEEVVDTEVVTDWFDEYSSFLVVVFCVCFVVVTFFICWRFLIQPGNGVLVTVSICE